MEPEKKRITVSFDGRSVGVAWYAGASDGALQASLRAALGLPAEAPVLLRDADGDVVALSDSLPGGLQLTAELLRQAAGAAPLAAPAPLTGAFLGPIPGPKPCPVVGNVFEFKDADSFNEPVSRLASIHGDFFQVRFFNKSLYICSDPELVRDLMERESDFPKVIHPRSPLHDLRLHTGGDGLFTTSDDEPAWQVAHRVLLPAFGMGALKQYYPRMLEVADDLFTYLDGLGEGRPFLATDLMTRMTLEAIAYAGFDTRFGITGDAPMPPFIDAMVEVLTDAMVSPQRLLPDALRPFGVRSRRQADAVLRETVDAIISTRRERMARGEPVPTDILQLMLAGRDRATGQTLSDENIRYQLITFLIAGHETTSGLLSYALYYLATHPEAEARVMEEADEVLGRDYAHRPAFADIDRLEYAQRVLKETLRLHPTAPAFTKTAAKDTVLGGRYALPRGSEVLVFLPRLQRQPAYWPDPDRFEPDRFLPEAVAARHPNAYHPFGLGMRSCIGFQFALIEARMVLARFYQRYRARLADPGYVLRDHQTLTIKPKDLHLVLERRPEEKGRLPVPAAPRAPQAAAQAAASGRPLRVLYGSNMGTSREVAEAIARRAGAGGFAPVVEELDAMVGALKVDVPVVIVTSTYNGHPPDNAARFAAWLAQAPEGALAGVRFAVLGCGNKQWRTTFQKFPRDLEARLSQLGAAPFHPAGACDADGDFEAQSERWTEGLWGALRARFGAEAGTDAPEPLLYDAEVVNYAGSQAGAVHPAVAPLHELARGAFVLRNDELQGPASERSTRHLEVSLPDGMAYAAGDHLGVLPENPIDLVEAAAQRCGVRRSDVVVLRPRPGAGSAERLPTGVPVKVHDLLASHVDLQGPVTRRELRALARHCPCPHQRPQLEALLDEARFKAEVADARLTLLQLLERFRAVECSLALLVSLRPALKPRYYSISSSPRALPGACAVTVGVHTAEAVGGRVLEGLCSHHLARAAAGAQLQVFVKDTGSAFRLPKDPRQGVVLVGPGTGLAPFRGFVQERAALRREGVEVGPMLLFFGCRHPEQDFLYRQELEAARTEGALTGLYVAFSREPGRERVYVQDLLREHAALVWDVVREGGSAYVCGDARRMAPAVAEAFAAVFEGAGGLSAPHAAALLERLKAEGRYHEDVWAS